MALSADPTKPSHPANLTNETTPLLRAPTSEPTALDNTPDPTNENDDPPRPYPYTQILLLCSASLVEPVAYFSIFPYINAMIYETGSIPSEDVGFWSGSIESLFSLVQMVLMIFYGRMADRLGRKPVLIFSLFGLGGAISVFGLSRTLWQMVGLRCLAGCFAGSAVTVRVMISENCDREGQARAFSWYAFVKNFGIFLGPLVGGVFARPAENYPGLFGNIQFFKDQPYALPNFVASLFAFVSATVCLFFLKETLQQDTDGQGNKRKPISTSEVLRSPGVIPVLYIFAHVAVLGLGFTAIAPVALFTPIDEGGFSFGPQAIAIYLAVGGISQSLFMLFVFPPLHRRIGTGNILRWCSIPWPILFLGFPLCNELRRHDLDTVFWIVGPTIYVLGCGVAMGFTCTQLFVNDIAPSASVLATANALALTVNSGIRAFIPVAASSLYALGVKLQWADGHLAFFVVAAIAAGLRIAILWLPEAAEGRPQKKDASGEVNRSRGAGNAPEIDVD